MSKLNVKTCNANKIFGKEIITSDIFKMVTFDNDFFSEEDLDNIGNGNEVDVNVNEGISGNEKMKKILKIVYQCRRAQWEDQHVNDFIENICKNEYF